MTAPQNLRNAPGKPVPEIAMGMAVGTDLNTSALVTACSGKADPFADAGSGTPAIAAVPTGSATSLDARGKDHCEGAEGYHGELFRFDRYRVSACRDGIQWLYQRQRPGFPAVGAAWNTLGYCTTRAALMRLHRAHTGAEVAEIAGLPERINAGAP